jgi:amidase
MDLSEYAQYDAVGLTELVKRKQVTTKELGRLFLTSVEKVNPKINAVIETYAERVGALENTPSPSGPFAGVPFLLKDLGATENGKRQECGSRLMKGYVADKDSFLTTRFKQAGLTLLGRSATPEFGLAGTTESILTGATRNPWNLEMLAGGSSGGAAASVAAGIIPIAHASDGAGSIRIPASACGLVGLKPSRGRVTQGPESAERLDGMVQEFVVSRTVRDTAVMLDAVSQPAPGDPFVIVQPQRPYRQEVNASPSDKLRVAWTAQSWQPGTAVHPEVVGLVEQVAAECDELGHQVVEATPVFDYEEYLHALCVPWEFGFDVMIDSLALRMGREVSEETLEPVTLSCYHYAQDLNMADMVSADRVLNNLRRTFGRFFLDYDVLVTPTLAQLPEPLGKYATTRTDLDFVDFMRLGDEINMHLPPFNVTGQPAISLPLGQSNSGLPMGVQFVARFGEEATLIRLASRFEQALPWRDRIPSAHVSK